MYFIEEVDKPCNIFRKVLPKAQMKDNKIIIYGLSDNLSEKKSIKLAKRTDKILKKTKSNKIVLSKIIQENDVYKNILYTYGYEILDGKWLFEGLSNLVIDYIVNKKKIKKNECQISVLVNDLTDYTLQNIKTLATEFKTLNIVTNHIEKFKKVEQSILEENGLVITITNNKKKSLLKSKLILNIDFPNELINKYNINDEAIIINICGNIKINKKRFNGLIINDYEVSVNNEIIDSSVKYNLSKYYIKQIYESCFYKNIPFLDFIKKVKKDKCEIDRLYSINGVL